MCQPPLVDRWLRALAVGPLLGRLVDSARQGAVPRVQHAQEMTLRLHDCSSVVHEDTCLARLASVHNGRVGTACRIQSPVAHFFQGRQSPVVLSHLCDRAGAEPCALAALVLIVLISSPHSLSLPRAVCERAPLCQIRCAPYLSLAWSCWVQSAGNGLLSPHYVS